ncbi:MAG: hypothetical protein DWH79_00565 [Planctomycetota bacterium]|nr:MAG: hypothetical protein DWH79_00565 [Planctomycetota bacterium]
MVTAISGLDRCSLGPCAPSWCAILAGNRAGEKSLATPGNLWSVIARAAAGGHGIWDREIGWGLRIEAGITFEGGPMQRAGNVLYAAWVLALLFSRALPACAADGAPPTIGYTEHATALPGGRLANVATGRAMLLTPGKRPIPLAADLADEPNSSTQFVGWFPDGKTAIIGRAWESEANAIFEEEHKLFRFRAGDWLYDTHLVDLASGQTANVTAVERVSFYNTGLFPWPGDAERLGFTALVNGISKPFAMNRDGTNKTNLARDSTGFAYGFSGSPDGKRIAYHENYQLWLADADGSNRRKIDTADPFVFAPSWSPDGQWLLFVSGEHYDCHPHVVRADGTGLRKIGDRNRYRGVMEFLDVPDFHGGSSDLPVWSHDGRSVFFTARVAGADGAADAVELFEVSLEQGAVPVRLTASQPGTLHYHPRPSPDGDWLLFGSQRAVATGGSSRNLFARRLAAGVEVQLTHLPSGMAAMHGHWQPVEVAAGPALLSLPRRRRLIYNFDGDSCLSTKGGVKGPANVSESDVTRLIDEVAFDGSQVDTVAVCINAQVLYYPTAVGTMRGTLSAAEEREAWPASEKQRFQNLSALFAAGVDPYAVMLKETRARGREAWISFRINDDHGDDFLRTAFRRDHPEWLIGGDRYAGRDALDFARPEVCDHVVALISEAAARYDCDGVELDFNRFPKFFKAGCPVEERVAIVNRLLWRVRGVLDGVGRERGRRVVLAIRVPSNYGRTPPTLATARAAGCDVLAWVACGLVDHVTVSEFLLERGDLPVEEWCQALGEVSLAFGIECTKGGGAANLTAEDYRAAASRLLKRGAKGVYLFNFFTSRERGAEASDPPYGIFGELLPAP